MPVLPCPNAIITCATSHVTLQSSHLLCPPLFPTDFNCVAGATELEIAAGQGSQAQPIAEPRD